MKKRNVTILVATLSTLLVLVLALIFVPIPNKVVCTEDFTSGGRGHLGLLPNKDEVPTMNGLYTVESKRTIEIPTTYTDEKGKIDSYISYSNMVILKEFPNSSFNENCFRSARPLDYVKKIF